MTTWVIRIVWRKLQDYNDTPEETVEQVRIPDEILTNEVALKQRKAMRRK